MKQFFIFLTIICIIVPIVVYTVAICNVIKINSNCIGYFELAANANSVTLAEKYLSKGIEYLESHNLTSGFTKIFIYKPTNDFSFWYENLKSAQDQLQELKTRDDLTELEESNALMKLRETLLDAEGQVTHPDGISFHPNYTSWFWALTLIWLSWIIAFIFGFIAYDS